MVSDDPIGYREFVFSELNYALVKVFRAIVDFEFHCREDEKMTTCRLKAILSPDGLPYRLNGGRVLDDNVPRYDRAVVVYLTQHYASKTDHLTSS